MLFREKPAGFRATRTVVGCFVERANRILLLQRAVSKPQPLTWGLPAGKVESHETVDAAMYRELQEETGLRVAPGSLKRTARVYIRYKAYEFVFVMYRVEAPACAITLSPAEHRTHLWVTPREALKLDLIPDLHCCICQVYRLSSTNGEMAA